MDRIQFKLRFTFLFIIIASILEVTKISAYVGRKTSFLCEVFCHPSTSGTRSFEKTIAAGADITDADTNWLAGTWQHSHITYYVINVFIQRHLSFELHNSTRIAESKDSKKNTAPSLHGNTSFVTNGFRLDARH